MPETNWQSKRVFVTGATGLVGSWLVKELVRQGAYCVVLMHDTDPQSELIRSGALSEVTVVNGALESFESLERAINEQEIETVFHLGAQPIVSVAHRNPLPTLEANIRGTYNLLEACRIHSRMINSVIVASSDKAYGESTVLPYTEDMPLAGKHPYEMSKSCTDLIAQSYAHTYNLPVVIARCGNIFGGGDLNWSRIIPGVIRSFLRGESPIIRSDGSFVRDYIFVEDVTSAYMTLAESISSKIVGHGFNFSPERPLSVLNLVEMIAEVMGIENIKPTILNQASGEIKSQYLDSTKAFEQLNWKPKFSIEAGLEKTVDWYREFFSNQNNRTAVPLQGLK